MSYTQLRRLVIFVSAFTVALLPFAVPAVHGSSAHAANKVTFLGGWGSGEETDFKAILSYCNSHYNVNVQYQYAPGGAVDTQLATQVQGGNPPDLAALSAPSEVQQYVNGNSIVPLTYLNNSKFKRQYSPFWRKLGTFSGKLYVLYMKADVKSLVWYSPKKFNAGNYHIPKTWSQLLTLSHNMVNHSKQPWAFGVGGSPASPWTLTDFLENVFLNLYGPRVYNDWIAHRFPWTNAKVKTAFQYMRQIIGNDKFIAGGRQRALSQAWDAAAKQMVQDPKAEFFQEATFVGAGLRSDLPKAKPGRDYNAFAFPSIKHFSTTPVEVGPNGIIAFNNNPGTKAVMRCLADPKALAKWAHLGGYISPNNALPQSAYPDPIAKMAARMLAKAGKANLVVGDASDLMPAALGSGFEFTELQKWFQNPSLSNTQTVLKDLENEAKKDYK
jgi:alpha-glucoside transport system substrate-binding protein